MKAPSETSSSLGKKHRPDPAERNSWRLAVSSGVRVLKATLKGANQFKAKY